MRSLAQLRRLPLQWLHKHRQWALAASLRGLDDSARSARCSRVRERPTCIVRALCALLWSSSAAGLRTRCDRAPTWMSVRLAASFWRGGTSRGLIVRAKDIAGYAPAVRERLLLQVSSHVAARLCSPTSHPAEL